MEVKAHGSSACPALRQNRLTRSDPTPCRTIPHFRPQALYGAPACANPLNNQLARDEWLEAHVRHAKPPSPEAQDVTPKEKNEKPNQKE